MQVSSNAVARASGKNFVGGVESEEKAGEGGVGGTHEGGSRKVLVRISGGGYIPTL
jgi:hypothetical protein